jgi:rhomboid protease GluP
MAGERDQQPVQGGDGGEGSGGSAPQQPPPSRQEEGRDWVDTVSTAAGWLGFNRVRVRWKLDNWRRRRGQARRRREQRSEHIHYQHKTCDNCGAVQDRDAAVCSRCGERLGGRRLQVLRRFGVLAPEWLSMSSLLGFAFVLAFARTLMASEGGLGDMLGLDARLLFEYGGSFAPAVEAGEYWRWLTACFLHGGIIHLGFNLFALAVVGPQVEALYGRLQMLFLFIVTGVIGFVGSAWFGPGVVSIGASGGLMGLVGVAAGWGHREGTGHGRAVRNDMLKWSAYVFVFGFFIQADNWAHLFGLLPGLAIGYAIRPRAWKLPALLPVRAAAGVVGAVAAAVALVLIARPPVNVVDKEQQAAAQLERRRQAYADICRLHWQGDTAGAVTRARALADEDAAAPAGDVGEMCDGFIQAREQCRSGAAPPAELAGTGGDAARTWRSYCDAIEQMFGDAPPPR